MLYFIISANLKNKIKIHRKKMNKPEPIIRMIYWTKHSNGFRLTKPSICSNPIKQKKYTIITLSAGGISPPPDCLLNVYNCWYIFAYYYTTDWFLSYLIHWWYQVNIENKCSEHWRHHLNVEIIWCIISKLMILTFSILIRS